MLRIRCGPGAVMRSAVQTDGRAWELSLQGDKGNLSLSSWLQGSATVFLSAFFSSLLIGINTVSVYWACMRARHGARHASTLRIPVFPGSVWGYSSPFYG